MYNLITTQPLICLFIDDKLKMLHDLIVSRNKIWINFPWNQFTYSYAECYFYYL